MPPCSIIHGISWPWKCPQGNEPGHTRAHAWLFLGSFHVNLARSLLSLSSLGAVAQCPPSRHLRGGHVTVDYIIDWGSWL